LRRYVRNGVEPSSSEYAAVLISEGHSDAPADASCDDGVSDVRNMIT
jgi:hypothetical protein